MEYAINVLFLIQLLIHFLWFGFMAYQPLLACSTMWLGCQSRRFNCLFWRETRQRILGHEISLYPEVVRGREWELTTRPREGSCGWTRERVGGRRAKRTVAAGQQRGKQQKAVGVEERTGAVNTRHRNREARRQDRVQWRRVSRCLIPVALWNFC